MRKIDEINDPNSCLNKAKDDEIIFVLRGSDEDMPGAVRDWIGRRVKRGKNQRNDPKMIDAEQNARDAEFDQRFDRRLALIDRHSELIPAEKTELAVLTATIISHLAFRFPSERVESENIDHFVARLRGNIK